MHYWLPLSHGAGWLRDLFGYLAGSLVLCTFSVTSMRRLRWLGIASNLSFIAYAIMLGMLPILTLHSLLLPVNIYRLLQIERDRRRAHPRGSGFHLGSPDGTMQTSTRAAMDATAVCPMNWRPDNPKMPASSWETC